MARPGYPCYRNILTALGCEVVELPCGAETRYQPTVAMLEALDEPVKGLVRRQPGQPDRHRARPRRAGRARAPGARTTACSSSATRSTTASPTRAPPRPSCAWATSREAIVVNSFSKYFSMTGWRLGWLLLPPRLLRAADCLAGNFTVCPPALPQVAALAAFDAESYAEADGHVARYQVNRDLLLDGLTRLGITRLAPADGAFYVYADVAHLTDDSMDLVYRLLADVGLAVAPGLDFDPVDGHRFIRLSCAGSAAEVREALVAAGALAGVGPPTLPRMLPHTDDEPRVAAWNRRADWPLTGLALVFLAAYAWSVLDRTIPPAGRDALEVLLTGIWVVFGLDYLIRIGLARRRVRFVLRHLPDLAILLLPMFRQLRILRLVTVLSVLNRQLRDDAAAGSCSTSRARSRSSGSSPRSPCSTPSGTPRTPRSPRSATRCGGRSRRSPRSATATATRSRSRAASSRGR